MKIKKNEAKTNLGRENRKTIVNCVLLVLLSLLMPTIAGVVIGVNRISNQADIYLIQFLAILMGCLILAVIVNRGPFTFEEIGFKKIKIDKWVFGIILVEVTALIFGFHSNIDLKTVVMLILFMISVGIFEEIIYRGLILRYLSRVSGKRAIIISSCIFGIGHIINLLGGADLKMTIAQIVFAFLFGIVCAQIVYDTKSISMVIIWHTVHNILSNLTSHPSENVQLLIVIVQCIILVGVSWGMIRSHNLRREIR